MRAPCIHCSVPDRNISARSNHAHRERKAPTPAGRIGIASVLAEFDASASVI
jgi:hypothetical protein